MKCVLAVALMMALAGCASGNGVSRRDYQEGLKDVSIGMTKREFLDVFPSAEPRGAKKYSTGVVEVLEVNVEQYSFFPTNKANYRSGLTGIEGQPRWFYFVKNELIQYGEPNDWPEADLVVKIK